MNRSLKILMLISLLGLSGCMQSLLATYDTIGAWGQRLYDSEPASQPKPFPREKERWCYRTLAAVDCYQKPQDLPAESLISVEPAERFPVTAEAYAQALLESKAREEVSADSESVTEGDSGKVLENKKEVFPIPYIYEPTVSKPLSLKPSNH